MFSAIRSRITYRQCRRDARARVRDDGWRLCREEVFDHLDQADQPERAEVVAGQGRSGGSGWGGRGCWGRRGCRAAGPQRAMLVLRVKMEKKAPMVPKALMASMELTARASPIPNSPVPRALVPKAAPSSRAPTPPMPATAKKARRGPPVAPFPPPGKIETGAWSVGPVPAYCYDGSRPQGEARPAAVNRRPVMIADGVPPRRRLPGRPRRPAAPPRRPGGVGR